MKTKSITLMIELFLDTLISSIAEGSPVEVEGDDTLQLNQLLFALRRINNDDEIEATVPDEIKDADGISYDPRKLHPLIKAASMLASSCLIRQGGECNWANIEFLIEQEFNIGPGKQDGLGWLTGVITTYKGNIEYDQTFSSLGETDALISFI